MVDSFSPIKTHSNLVGGRILDGPIISMNEAALVTTSQQNSQVLSRFPNQLAWSYSKGRWSWTYPGEVCDEGGGHPCQGRISLLLVLRRPTTTVGEHTMPRICSQPKEAEGGQWQPARTQVPSHIAQEMNSVCNMNGPIFLPSWYSIKNTVLTTPSCSCRPWAAKLWPNP